MKKIIVLAFALIVGLTAKSQILTPVKWSYAAKRTSATEAVVLIKATIDKGWHIYAQNTGEGPVPTSFTFEPGKNFSLVGKTVEPKPISKFDSQFNSTLRYFENSVVFQQKVKLKSAQATTVKGKLEFMVCNDSKCLPPDEVEFSVPVKAVGK